MTRESFIEMATAEEKKWDVTAENDYIHLRLMGATIKSTDSNQIIIQPNHRDSIALDIGESEIDVIDEDYQYSFTVAGTKFKVCESIL